MGESVVLMSFEISYVRLVRMVLLVDEGRREAEEMSDFLCIGDFICLYCEETEGYLYNWQSR